MGGVLVPASVHGVAHHVSGLGEDFLDEDLLATQHDPLAQVGRDADHQTLAGRRPLGLAFCLPALQLAHHRSKLVVLSLLVKLGEVLRRESQDQLINNNNNNNQLITDQPDDIGSYLIT